VVTSRERGSRTHLTALEPRSVYLNCRPQPREQEFNGTASRATACPDSSCPAATTHHADRRQLVILFVGGIAVAAAIAWPSVGVALGIGVAVIVVLVVLTR